ncbi:hypothetical protein [Streptomyces sp. NPDC101249]|uniref:hypothetical protein n=1 Tax=Streptomyces sp. NPDC101249 TaxID=3366140 RepID=UPI00382C7BFE
MNRIALAHQVSLTLGDHADDYDIDGIIDALADAHDGELTSIDDVDSAAYWEIVKTHDTTADASGDDGDSEAGTVAWLGVTANATVTGRPEVMVLDHQQTGDETQVMPDTALPVSVDDDHSVMQAAAVTALQAAGWSTTGGWDAVDTGYTITVRRA